ncbi:MAG: hypothetical protein R2862_12085 [Thermoanaerobaculia bacterium]
MFRQELLASGSLRTAPPRNDFDIYREARRGGRRHRSGCRFSCG